MAYIYREVPGNEAQLLKEHLTSCSTCQSRLQEWQGTLEVLKEWRVPGKAAISSRVLAPLLKWGLAAAILMGIGLFLGKMTSPQVDAARIRADVAQSLRREFEQDFAARLASLRSNGQQDYQAQLQSQLAHWASTNAAFVDHEVRQALTTFVESYETAHERDRQNFIKIVNALDQRQRLNYANLRQDLETVALTADDRLLRTEYKLGQIASVSDQNSVDPSNDPNSNYHEN